MRRRGLLPEPLVVVGAEAAADPGESVGATPTLVESTGTSQASPSRQARPKPSLSEVIRTALAAFSQSGIRSGSMSPPTSRVAPTAAASSAARSWRFSGRVGLAGKSRYRPSGSRPSSCRASERGTGYEARQVEAAGENGACARDVRQPGTPTLRREQGARDARDEIYALGQPAGIRPDNRVAHVGAVEGDEQRPRPGELRAPAGEAVVGVDEVEALAAEQAAQAPGRRRVLAPAHREAEQLDLDSLPSHLLDLVGDPAASLRGARVGHEVGDDEDPHRAPAYPRPRAPLTTRFWDDRS